MKHLKKLNELFDPIKIDPVTEFEIDHDINIEEDKKEEI